MYIRHKIHFSFYIFRAPGAKIHFLFLISHATSAKDTLSVSCFPCDECKRYTLRLSFFMHQLQKIHSPPLIFHATSAKDTLSASHFSCTGCKNTLFISYLPCVRNKNGIENINSISVGHPCYIILYNLLTAVKIKHFVVFLRHFVRIFQKIIIQ